MTREQARKKLKTLLDVLREDFKRRLKFYPSAFLVHPKVYRRTGCRRYKGSDVRPFEGIKRLDVTRVMDHRAYQTWRFNREINGLPV